MREAASARASSGPAPPTAQTSTAAPSQSRQRSKAFLFMTDFPPLWLMLSKTCPLLRPERKDLSTATFSLRQGKPCPYKTRHRRGIVPVHRLGGGYACPTVEQEGELARSPLLPLPGTSPLVYCAPDRCADPAERVLGSAGHPLFTGNRLLSWSPSARPPLPRVHRDAEDDQHGSGNGHGQRRHDLHCRDPGENSSPDC